MAKEEKQLSEYYDGLATELSECRQETRNNETLIIQILAVAGAFMAFVYGAFFGEKKEISESLKTNFLILDIMIECAAYYYIVILGIRNVLLYHFSRDIEYRMAEYEIQHAKKPVVRWTSLISPIVTRNIKHVKTRLGFWHYIAYTLAIMSAVLFAFAVTFYQYLSFEKDGSGSDILRRIGISYFFISLIVIVVIFFSCAYRTHEMYNELRQKQMIKIENKQSLNSAKKISMKSILETIIYYLYPKVCDMQKAVLFIIGWIIGTILLQKGYNNFFTSINIVEMVKFIFVMDFCFYQARYHWNDLRGLRYDVDKKKRRIPVRCLGIFWSIVVTQIVMTAKVILGVIVAYKFYSLEEFKITMILGILLFMITSAYEFAKTNRITGIILFTVCLGYPYRILSGVVLKFASINKIGSIFSCYNIWLVCLIILAYLAYGGFAVYIAWICEVIKYKRENAKEIEQPHLRWLYDYIKDRIVDKKRKNPFRESGKILDPWNIMYLISIGILSLIVVLFMKEYWKCVAADEAIIIIFSIILVKQKNFGMIVSFAGTVIFIILSIFVINILGYGSLSFVGLNQLFFVITYFVLTFLWDEEFNFANFMKDMAIKIEKCIIGNDTYEFCKKYYDKYKRK